MTFELLCIGSYSRALSVIDELRSFGLDSNIMAGGVWCEGNNEDDFEKIKSVASKYDAQLCGRSKMYTRIIPLDTSFIKWVNFYDKMRQEYG